jgi:hypothetical protein
MTADGPLPNAAFVECSALGKDIFAECISVRRVLHSVNELIIESKTLPSAALGKDIFAEYISVSRVLHSVNELVIESRILPSAALDKDFFAECPTKSTRQRPVFR